MLEDIDVRIAVAGGKGLTTECQYSAGSGYLRPLKPWLSSTRDQPNLSRLLVQHAGAGQTHFARRSEPEPNLTG